MKFPVNTQENNSPLIYKGITNKTPGHTQEDNLYWSPKDLCKNSLLYKKGENKHYYL